METEPNAYQMQRQAMAMESLVEGIREGLDNAARAERLADRMGYLKGAASLCKILRTNCNRALMELERTNTNKRKHLTP